ncbi:hypothetical protein BgiBS90_024610, partial [Biomphalaria glabrata]
MVVYPWLKHCLPLHRITERRNLLVCTRGDLMSNYRQELEAHPYNPDNKNTLETLQLAGV